MKAILFALLGAVTIFNTVGCGKGTPRSYYLLNARFSAAQTLAPGDPVMMAGIQIGYVESIALDPPGGETVVRMEIKRSVVVKTDSTATIIPEASPGRSIIALDSGSPGAPAAEPGAVMKAK